MTAQATVFDQAIKQLLPQLDDSLQGEIREKVTAHMWETLKELVFQNDPKGLAELGQDSTEYLKQILNQFNGLDKDRQKEVNQLMDEELTKVMHQIYQAAN